MRPPKVAVVFAEVKVKVTAFYEDPGVTADDYVYVVSVDE